MLSAVGIGVHDSTLLNIGAAVAGVGVGMA